MTAAALRQARTLAPVLVAVALIAGLVTVLTGTSARGSDTPEPGSPAASTTVTPEPDGSSPSDGSPEPAPADEAVESSPAPTALATPRRSARLTTTRGAPVRIRYAAGAGTAHTYLAWVPPGSTGRRAVVLVHGGAWVRGHAKLMAGMAHRLYDRGIPSFSLEYRLADRTNGRTAWGAQRSDVRNAVAHVKGHAGRYGIARGRLAAVGSSAGGHLVSVLGSQGAGRGTVRSVVAYSPPEDMKAIWDDRTTGGPSAYSLAGRVRQDLLQCSPGSSKVCKARWRSATPPLAASRGDAPTLLFYQRNELVSPSNGWAFRAAYKKASPSTPVGLDIRAGSQHASDYVFDTQGGISERVWKRTVRWVLTYT